MTPVLFIIEVAWTEVTEATKNNKIMKYGQGGAPGLSTYLRIGSNLEIL